MSRHRRTLDQGPHEDHDRPRNVPFAAPPAPDVSTAGHFEGPRGFFWHRGGLSKGLVQFDARLQKNSLTTAAVPPTTAAAVSAGTRKVLTPIW